MKEINAYLNSTDVQILNDDIISIYSEKSHKIPIHNTKVLTYIGMKDQLDEYTQNHRGINSYCRSLTENADSNLFFIFIYIFNRSINFIGNSSSLNDILTKDKLYNYPFYNKYPHAVVNSFYCLTNDTDKHVFDDEECASTLNTQFEYTSDTHHTANLSPQTCIICEQYKFDSRDIDHILANEDNDPGSIHKLGSWFTGKVYVDFDIPVYDFSGLHPDY